MRLRSNEIGAVQDQPSHCILSFNGFALDLIRGCLLSEAGEIKLRPKSFEVLKLLVLNSGRLLSKEELVEAVWPGTAVTDDSLVQCLIDVRRALGDREQQIIKTVPRRGYLFDTLVVATPAEETLIYTEELETLNLAVEEEIDDQQSRLNISGPTSADLASLGTRKPLNKLGRYTLLAVIAAFVLSAGGLGAYFIAGRSTSVNSLAVLPLINVSGDAEMDYLADGLTESIINNLSQLSELKVVPRSSAFRYKGRSLNVSNVARELGVSAMLTGRVEQHGDKLTISLELVDVRENRQLWGERYTRPVSGLLELQTQISQRVSEKLGLRLEDHENARLAKRYTNSPEAYQLYLRGRYHWDKWLPGDVRKSILYFEQAISLDPNFALAYTGLADAYSSLNGLGASPPLIVMPKAKAAVERALDLDPSLSEAYVARGMIRHFYDWDFAGGDQDFLRAIALNPNSASAHHLYGKNLLDTGRFDEAMTAVRRALELDPYSVGINKDLGEILFYSRRYDQAVAQLQRTLELEPNYATAYYWLARTYEVQGLHDLCVDAYLKILPLSESTSVLRDTYARRGWKGFSEVVLEQANKRAEQAHYEPYYMALHYLRDGDKEKALQWLEKAYEARSSWIATITYDPGLDSLRSDRRFQELLRRSGVRPSATTAIYIQ